MLTTLARVPKGRQAVLITEDDFVVLEWNKTAENPLVGRVNASKVTKKSYQIDFNYNGRLFLVQNYNHQYAFLIDSSGVVHAFYNNKPDVIFSLSLFIGQSIVPGEFINIGALALDWNEDILVFYNEGPHCIESVKLTDYLNAYKITCFDKACPPVRNLMIDVNDQKVYYNIRQKIEVASMLGDNSMSVQCIDPPTSANKLELEDEVKAENILMDYYYKQRSIYVLNSDQGVLQNVSALTYKAKQNTIHNSSFVYRNAKFYSHTGTLSFWFEPINRTAYMFRTLGKFLHNFFTTFFVKYIHVL